MQTQYKKIKHITDVPFIETEKADLKGAPAKKNIHAVLEVQPSESQGAATSYEFIPAKWLYELAALFIFACACYAGYLFIVEVIPVIIKGMAEGACIVAAFIGKLFVFIAAAFCLALIASSMFGGKQNERNSKDGASQSITNITNINIHQNGNNSI